MSKIDDSSIAPITIRRAEPSDIDTVIHLFDGYRQFYGKNSDLDAVREFLMARFAHRESVMFIAFDGEKAVGFTQLYPSFSSVSLARIFVLNDLFVIQSARRSGVASKLLLSAINFSRDKGAVRVSLSTAIENYTAQQYFDERMREILG